MNTLLDWIDRRSGLCTALRDWMERPVAGGPDWRLVWPSTIAFAFVVQAITGLVLWMYYSPGAQSAWESVYYLQYQVQGGWLLRAMHYYCAQVTLVLAGLYAGQIILRRGYRAPRELLFWTVLLMVLVTLGLNLTGDLLAWDQNSLWATRVRTGFLLLLPVIGDGLNKLAVGGADFGSLTLTRFLALHAGVFAAALGALVLLHAWLARRDGLATDTPKSPSLEIPKSPPSPYWPRQALRDMTACLVVLAVVLALSLQHGVAGPEAGVELGAPANLVDDPGTARPEWSFRGLFQFRELFMHWLPKSPELVPIFVISGLVVLVFFAMPWIGHSPAGHRLNVAFTAVVLLGLAALTWRSYSEDARNVDYLSAVRAGRLEGQRAKELSLGLGIPAGGALALLRDDPQTQGPRLFKQYCSACHDCSGSSRRLTGNDGQEPASAPNLYGFAGREWVRGLFDPRQIKGPMYFGNTKLKRGQMPAFVEETLSSAEPEEIDRLTMALSAEAKLKSQRPIDARDAARIAQGKRMLAQECTDCHTFHGKGTAKGPDLTDYGSRSWLIGIICDPAHRRFYGTLNDRMPAYAPAATEPAGRILTDRELGLLADWLRGQWWEPGEQ
ncbi:MAG: cytochrome b N-terminal domain-containing protein [Thermoguttaceae bacterium]|jgi:ubiquinol-cytochrome c reductase cytochrome b subunit